MMIITMRLAPGVCDSGCPDGEPRQPHQDTSCFMYGFYHHFNNLRFGIRLNITGFPVAISSVFFVSSEFLKCRLLKGSLPHPMNVLRPISLLRISLLRFVDSISAPFPMDMRIPALGIKILLGSNSLKFRILVYGDWP